MTECLQCVSCHRGDRRGKLLRCLHVLCVGCAPQHLTLRNDVLCPGCSHVTLPRDAGKQQLTTLPNVSPIISSSSNQTDQKLYCGECEDDTEAVSSCVDCCELLCDSHAKVHPVSRSSYKHRLQPIHGRGEGSGNPKSCAKFCISHAGHELHAFCMECKQLMCELCEHSMTNHESSHSMLPVERAQQEMRKSLKGQLAVFTADKEAAVTTSAEQISISIQQLHDRTEAVSEQVNEYFDGVMKAVEARRDQVLEDLDQLRHIKLVPLQDQKRRLERSVEMVKTAAALVDGCDDSWNFLQLSSVLAEALNAATAASNGDLAPCVQADLVFQKQHSGVVRSALDESVVVMDTADMDFNCALVCPPFVDVGSTLAIAVKRLGANQPAVTANMVAQTSLKVEVTCEGASSACGVTPSHDGREMVTKYVPKTLGEMQVSATYGDRQLVGSPANVTRLRQTINWSVNHASYITMATDHQSWTCENNCVSYGSNTKEKGLVYSGRRLFREGRTHVRICLNELHGKCIDIFLSKSSYPKREDEVYGWTGRRDSERSHTLRVAGLGQPWSNGDLIYLTYSGEHRSLTAFHSRTRAVDSVPVPDGEYYLAIQMACKGQRVSVQ